MIILYLFKGDFMLKNFTTKTKLFFFPILFIIIICISAYVYIHYSNIVEGRNDIAVKTEQFIQQVLKGRISVYQFLQNPTQEKMKPVLDDFQQLTQNVSLLKEKMLLKSNQILCEEIVELSNQYITFFNTYAEKRINDLNNGIKEESPEIKSIISKMVLIGKDLENKLHEINKSATNLKHESTLLLNEILLAVVFISVIAFILISMIIANIIIKSLNNFKEGFISFFDYLNKKSENIKLLNDKGKDEFSLMSKVLNENIKNTQKAIEEDALLIDDVKRIVQEVKCGILYKKIEHNTNNKNLQELKIIFNQMLETMAENICGDINKIQNALDIFSKLDFRHRVPNPTGKTSQGLNQLANIINEMLIENKKNGLTLQYSANELLSNVETLSSASNQAAASLEETAAALEEITSNISSNTQNVIKMSGFANQLQLSANDGEKLANQTTISMDEINVQVEAINEAISVIDQIAFQTNILSLNAAVEAATAGESGKGFAVVAAEVRNLASRSAEAAKEIKTLVENATAKANHGKEIADKMIHGYHGLNGNIIKTLELIKDVENASKEQYAGIEQINNAVSQLDQQTQLNANVAAKTKEIAISTQKIAQIVVDNANEKEFLGKDETVSQ